MDNYSRILELICKGEEIEKQENHSSIRGLHVVYGEQYDQWMSSINAFANRSLKDHPLYNEIVDAYNNRKGMHGYDDMMGHLRALAEDQDFFKLSNQHESEQCYRTDFSTKQLHTRQDALHYDVFISHANSDKEEYVNCLKASIDQLNVNVFYDKDTFVWGDNWKKKLLEGINAAEFAIVVISENYFGREWTEKELNDFFERQNSIGQKIILPILHNISIHQLKEHYPHIANIQAIESSKYSCDQIALLFARLLIERIRSNNSTVSSEKRMDFHPSDPVYTSRLKQAYHSLLDFRDAINRADQEIINQKSIILTQSFQELYNFFEFYSGASNTNAVHVRFVQEIVAQYNVSVNSLHSFLAGSRDVNSLQHTNDELKKLLNLIIKALQEEGEKL